MLETMVATLEELSKQKLITIKIMKKFSSKVDVETFNYLIGLLARVKLGKEVSSLFAKMKDQYLLNLQTYTMLLFGYCKMKNVFEAVRI